MARRKKKRNLNSELKNHQNNLKNQNNLADRLDDGVETSVIDQYAAPNVGDLLHSDIPETQAEANRGLENTSVQANDYLEGSPISQPVAEGNVESETDAGVADGETRPHPGETVGEEEAGLNASLQPEDKKASKVKSGVSTSVINQYAAPNVGDMLHSDIPETQAEANRGLENTTVQSNDYLEKDSIEQHQAEGDAEAETDAAVADGTTKPHPGETVGEEEAGLNASLQPEGAKATEVSRASQEQGVSTSVVNQYAAPNVGDMLHSDIPETQAEANRGLNNTTVQSNDYLEGDSIEQHQAEGDAQAETDAAVAAGTTNPHPGQTVGQAAAGLNASLQPEESQEKARVVSQKKGVSTSVVNQYGAPNMNDMLHSDVPETQAEADRGLNNTTVQSNDYLEGDSIEQHQAEGDAQAETDAAVAAGTTNPHPGQTAGEENEGLNASLQPEGTEVVKTQSTSQKSGVTTSVVNQYAAPNVGDMLHSDIPETQAEADRGLNNTTVQSNDYLEGDSIEQHQAEGDAQAETDAAVAAGTTNPHPGQTVGQAAAGLNASLQPEGTKAAETQTTPQKQGVTTSVVNKYAAPNVGDMLHSDIPETQAQADRGLNNTTVQSDDYLEQDAIEQHQAEGNAQAETDAAVTAGTTNPHPGQTVGEENAGLNASLQPEGSKAVETKSTSQKQGVTTSVVNQYAAPNVGDMLHSDVPETQAQADRGLNNTTVQSNDYLEQDAIEQHQAEGDVQAETDAAVAAGDTEPKPAKTVGQEQEDIPESMKLSPEEVNKLFNDPVENVTINIDADEAHVNVEEPQNDDKKYNALNHSIEKDLPIYLL